MAKWMPVEKFQTKWRGTTLTFSLWDKGTSPVIITESDTTHIVLLPDDLRLCRLTDAPGDMPPYHIKEAIGNVWGYVYANAGREDLAVSASQLMGWLHALAQQPATTMTIPAEVRDTLRRSVITSESINSTNAWFDRVTAALAWIDALP